MKMRKLKAEGLYVVIIILSLFANLLQGVFVEGRKLEPIFWNSSNPVFKNQPPGQHLHVTAAINDKMDIICPHYKTGGGDDGLLYFKLFLVSKENFRKCNSTGGRRLLTCGVPEREKKYSFFFQEISPSPWGLEFQPHKSYYVVSTSDGSKPGIDEQNGGVCTRFNMKFELAIQEAVGEAEDLPDLIYPSDKGEPRNPEHIPIDDLDVGLDEPNNSPKEEPPSTNEESPPHGGGEVENRVSGNGLIIGAALGAFAVLFICLLAFLGYKVYRKRRLNKKYQSPSITPTRGTTPFQQVTLLPIGPPTHHHHARLLSDRERHRSATLSSHGEVRPPPSYNETFLENGGTMVEV